MTTLRSPARRAVRGISLIEAAIAVAVMSIGILALVGVQTTLRFNNDLARQRVDASRIAAQEVENLRFFTTLDHVNGAANPAWDDLASRTVESYALPDATNNATFRIDRSAIGRGIEQAQRMGRAGERDLHAPRLAGTHAQRLAALAREQMGESVTHRVNIGVLRRSGRSGIVGEFVEAGGCGTDAQGVIARHTAKECRPRAWFPASLRRRWHLDARTGCRG